MTEEGLRKDMLTFEPLRMVNMRLPSCTSHAPQDAVALHTLELSNLDHLYDYYNSISLFYRVHTAFPPPLVPHHGGAPQFPAVDTRSGASSSECTSVPISNDSCGSHVDPAFKLQTALEELLLHYPAAAGRLHINQTTGRYEVKYKAPTSSSSSCFSEEDAAAFGVPFIVARANTAFSTLGDVTAPHPSLDVLYPSAPKRNPNNQPPPPLLFIQVTTFTCGSFTMAFTLHHMLTDGYAITIFMKNLGSIAKGAGLAASMDMQRNRREVMKPREPPAPVVEWHPHICTLEQQGNKELPYGVATRFSLNAGALEALRLRASHPNTKLCSRFQALVAFLWVIRAKCLANSGSSPSLKLPLRFPINIRARGFPNIPQGYVGNAIFQCSASATIQELCESSFTDVVAMITSSTGRGIDIQERVQSEIDCIELQLQNGRVPSIDHAFLGMPSSVALPLYDIDFGWGRPIYSGRPSRQLGQRILILDDPRSERWNVLVVLRSQEEHNIFQEEIAGLITFSSKL